MSLPVRGAWIEMEIGTSIFLTSGVAPCEGSVD